MKELHWIDVHTHLNMLEVSAEEAVQQAVKAGVTGMITIGTGLDDFSLVVELAEKQAPYVYGTLGVHPHDATTWSEETESFMRSHLNLPRIVAVGEIGLDYYYDQSPRDTQREVFAKQLALAEEFHLPVQVHSRDAEKETIEGLKEFEGRVNGLIHCFTGSQWLADEALALGFNISISGIVTFPKAQALQEVVKNIPLDRLHVETDAPFLTPVPFRGKKNTPSYVVHTAQKVAELKGVEVEELSRATQRNTKNLFSKIKD